MTDTRHVLRKPQLLPCFSTDFQNLYMVLDVKNDSLHFLSTIDSRPKDGLGATSVYVVQGT